VRAELLQVAHPKSISLQVVRKLRRLPWAASEAYLVRCLMGAARARVSAAPHVASLAAGLARYHPSLGVALADAVLEEARLLRVCKLFQFALLCAKLVGLRVRS